MDYKVHKEISRNARVLGLKLRAFYVFIISGVLALLSLGNNITFLKTIVIICLIVVLYIVLLFLQNFDFEQFNDNLPDEINN